MADPGRDGLGVPDVQRQAGPAEAGAELPAAQERRQPARAGQQVHGRADDGPLEGFPGRAGARAGRAGLAAGGRVRVAAGGRVRAGVCVGVGVAELAEFGAQPDQVLQHGRVDVAGDDRGHGRVTGDRLGGIAVQPRPAVPAALGGFGAVPGPGGADLGGPFLLQGGAAVQPQQVGQGHVRPHLDRLPGPLGQQARRDQAPHRLLQRVVIPLRLRAVILGSGRGGQRVQHRAHDRGALGGQVTVHHARAAEGGLQPHAAVLERPRRVLVGQVRAGPLVDLGGQPG